MPAAWINYLFVSKGILAIPRSSVVSLAVARFHSPYYARHCRRSSDALVHSPGAEEWLPLDANDMKPTSEATTTLRDYLGALRARRGLIIATTLVAVAVGAGYSLIKTPIYETEATLEFTEPDRELPVIAPAQIQAEQLPDKQAAADTRVVTRDDVVERVRTELGTNLSNDELKDKVQATVQPDSNLVAITVSSGEAEEAAQIANEFAKQTRLAEREEARADYARKAKEVQRASAGEDDPVIFGGYRVAISRLKTLASVADPVAITRPAAVPSRPASPKPIRDTVLAAILGLIVGVGAAFVTNALDRRIKDPHDVRRELGLPLVGYVGADALGLAGVTTNGGDFVSEDDLEAFRILRSNVDFLAGSTPFSSVVVTSALPEEGKSTVAALYAYVNALAGRRTLLVDCDFRRPVLAERLGVEPVPGLTNFLEGEVRPNEVLRSVSVTGREAVDVLPLIPAGDNAFQPAEAIASAPFSSFLEQVTKAYDLVVFDSAPLLPVGDTLELIPQVDGILLCVRLDQTTRQQARAASEALKHLPEKPTGLVVTGVQRGSDDDYYGYYSSYAARAEAPNTL